MKRTFLPAARLADEPYSAALAFPRATRRQLSSRLAELGRLGVTGVAFWGPVRVGRLDLLGKGYAGVVVLARLGGRTVALKIRRADSPRKSLAGEARLLAMANTAGAGPRLVSHSRNFVAMQYVAGPRISDWAAAGPRAAEARAVISGVLAGCRRLDKAGIDHGELSNISKHVIVGKRPVIIDFESASTARRPANVTSAAQSLLIGSGIARAIGRACRLPPKQEIIAALRRYKQEPTDASYAALSALLRL